MYQTILFDLDGTLTNSELGITNSVAYALGKYGIEVPDKKALRVFIGPPLQDSFEIFYGFSKEESLKAVEAYREYFSEKGLYENEVYPGIPELLSELKRAGKKLIVATSKPEGFSVQILKHFGLYDYFDFVSGATMDGSRRKKSDIIQHALESMGITNLAETLMIGDREHDVIGAQTQKIDSIGVLYGFGSREELETAGATYIAPEVGHIAAFIG
ncbi:HAD family hydrolase [Streptococcus cristatus]|uniref:Phosphoglycolate phosphatase n=1 Tax=Streptococcus cristatus TaxID=45634 RepID=A0A139N4I8_STRCR|nr:HAD family hydrolase [Streptococcus cristatus]KXT70949.1 Phosphoglycolate phosphatase [Streptococcus cristatus]